MEERRYPIGIQTFSRIIREGYIYVDKTDLVWQLAHYSTFVFMSRPRRFGKSLLTSTLESYFKGEKKLFEGLKIMELEKEWEQYPVIRLDLSTVKNQSSAGELSRSLMWMMRKHADCYGRETDELTPGQLLSGIIHRAYEITGKQVAVIIDEYDAPLLDVLHEGNMIEDMRKVMQEFYQPLKASESIIKFCFLTGITRLSQLNIFSTLNNLTNVSTQPEFAAICGITDEELNEQLTYDVSRLAEAYECTADDVKSYEIDVVENE